MKTIPRKVSIICSVIIWHAPFWQLFDSVIAATGAILLLICYRYAHQMETPSVSGGLTSGNAKG